MNKKTILFLMVLSLAMLVCLSIWGGMKIANQNMPWWIVTVCSLSPCLLLIIMIDRYYYLRLRRYIDNRFESIGELFERHSHECPVRREQLINSCMQSDESPRNSDAFRRSFVASFPLFLPNLRKIIPSITPVEEILCMFIKMGLSNKEIADRMSISQGSLHTTRYRFRRKLPPEAKENMDEWIKDIA